MILKDAHTEIYYCTYILPVWIWDNGIRTIHDTIFCKSTGIRAISGRNTLRWWQDKTDKKGKKIKPSEIVEMQDNLSTWWDVVRGFPDVLRNVYRFFFIERQCVWIFYRTIWKRWAVVDLLGKGILEVDRSFSPNSCPKNSRISRSSDFVETFVAGWILMLRLVRRSGLSRNGDFSGPLVHHISDVHFGGSFWYPKLGWVNDKKTRESRPLKLWLTTLV
jgi:hypothetical protein